MWTFKESTTLQNANVEFSTVLCKSVSQGQFHEYAEQKISNFVCRAKFSQEPVQIVEYPTQKFGL